jgi:hypothetical protein
MKMVFAPEEALLILYYVPHNVCNADLAVLK